PARFTFFVLLLTALLTTGCQNVRAATGRANVRTADNSMSCESARQYDRRGVASWYGAPHHGRQTASGDIYDMNKLTGAHRSLPLGPVVRVTNLTNAKSAVITINDRGPYAGGRTIDVSHQAARRLGFVSEGTTPVRIQVLGTCGDTL